MAIRRLVLVALLAGAGVAQAEVVSTSQPGFLSGWTTGNGTDVLGSGVLAGNLVGGISHSAGGSADLSLSDVLYGKASANLSEANGQTKLFFQRGIEGTYLLGSGNGILAARLGDGKSVVSSVDGAIISEGSTGGGAAGVGGGAGGSFSGGAGGGVGGGQTGGGPDNNAGAPGQSVAPPSVGNGGIPLPGVGTGLADNPGKSQVVLPAADVGVAAIPEPSTVGLMLAGLLGAGALQRRRKS